MKKPKPVGSMEGPGGLKAFATFLVDNYALGPNASRFSVVSFQSVATTRVGWSTNQVDINAAIDQMEANGMTSISAGFEAAGLLFANGSPGATKVVLLFSDGEQSDQFAAPGKTASQTAVDAAGLVKASGVTVFAWGFGNGVSLTTLGMIATDSSKTVRVQDLKQLSSYLEGLQAAVCNKSPPLSPPPPSPSPPPSPPLLPPPSCFYVMPNANTQCEADTYLTETECDDYRVASGSFSGLTGGFDGFPRGCFAYGTTIPPAIYFGTQAIGSQHSSAKPVCMTAWCDRD